MTAIRMPATVGARCCSPASTPPSIGPSTLLDLRRRRVTVPLPQRQQDAEDHQTDTGQRRRSVVDRGTRCGGS